MKFLWQFIAAVFVVNQVTGTYVITTPRRWPAEGLVQVCVSLLDGVKLNPLVDEWFVTINDANEPKEILAKTELSLPEGETMACRDVRRPKLDTTKAEVRIEGQFAGTQFSEAVNVTVGGKIFKTFIQPDKAIYKPGQKVQFRMLTIMEKMAPFINTSPNGIWKEPYDVVYVETPRKVRIAQWRNVSNNGLVHLSLDLHDEADEGMYRISVDHGLDTTFSVGFTVRQYTLPRYEVTVSSPHTIYGNASEVQLELCAKYTFGQNVRGNGSMSVAVGSYSRQYANITEHALVDGCATYTFPTDTLRFDDNNCHIRISSIKVDGKVAEEGTDNVIYLKQTTFNVNRVVVSFKDISKSATKNNYLPSQMTVQAEYPGGVPAVNEIVEACASRDGHKICRNFTTDDNGILEILFPSEHTDSVELRAVNHPTLERNFNFVMEEGRRHIYRGGNKEFTKVHNTSVTIYYFDKLECKDGEDIQVTLPIIYVTDGQTTADVKVQTMSKGYVFDLHNETIQLKNTPLPFNYQQFLIPLKPVPDNVIRGMANITLTLPLTVSPEVTITVWFKTEKNAVVADTRTLDVTPCLGNNVDFSWSTNKTGPGMPVIMTVTAEMNSLCSIGVVDKSVELLGAPDKLTAKSLLTDGLHINTPKRWDEDQLNLKYCLKKYKNEKAEQEISTVAALAPAVINDIYRTSVPYSRDIEAIEVFKIAGYHVFSPLNLEKEVCDSLLHKALKALAQQQSFLSKQRPEFAVLGSGAGTSPNRIMSTTNQFQDAPQSFAAIAHKEGTVTEEVTRERVFFPETWLWELRTLESTELSETLTMPDTITEWIGSAVCIGRETGVGISNEASITTFTPFFVELNLPPTVVRGEHFPVVISIFSYSKSPLSVNLLLEKSPDFDFVDVAGTIENGERSFCLNKFEKFVRTIIIKPKIIGDMNITVEATSNRGIDACYDPNEPLKSDRIIKPVLVEAEGVTRERVWTQYVCPEDSDNQDITWDINLPAEIVMDSERAWINVIGDLLGPSLKNIGSLVNKPYGCGEQNLITFVPNVFILDYLNASNQLVPELEDKLKAYMSSGYQRQLRFVRFDGSFSTFGVIDNVGSTWLTAFVLKGFSHAGRYIAIANSLMQRSVAFLKTNQAPDGCFYEEGKVINKAIAGGSPASEQSLLTAYVVSSLIESDIKNVEGVETIITAALPCILKDTSTHPYNLALRAYSLALAKSPEAKNVIEQLKVLAVTTSSEMRWNLPEEVKNSALNVETAAYALLSFLISDPTANRVNSRKIVRWLSSQRNGRGGFVSTQDTVMALQALSMFERIQPSEAVNVTVSAKNTQLDQVFNVDEQNKLVEQRHNVISPKENVTFNIAGTGCTLIQGVLRYNVLSKSSGEFFSLDVTPSVDAECEYHNITICASYLLADGASNMANIEIKLVTGYNPVEEDLKTVVLSSPFKRYEINEGKIVFYLDQITSNNVCASFRATQDLIVGNAQPGVVKVYDYYQPELSREQTFNLEACKTSYEICIDPLTKRPVNTQNSNSDLC